MKLDPQDRDIIRATQAGLPLTDRPYRDIAATVGLSEPDVIPRMRALQARGVLRRVALAPNHYRLGMTANGMTVWDVDDTRVAELGALVGALDFVSHCYERPRALPVWPYNLFAMVHGSSRAEVENKRARIVTLLGDACRASDTLYSKRILKQTGLRLSARKD